MFSLLVVYVIIIGMERGVQAIVPCSEMKITGCSFIILFLFFFMGLFHFYIANLSKAMFDTSFLYALLSLEWMFLF